MPLGHCKCNDCIVCFHRFSSEVPRMPPEHFKSNDFIVCSIGFERIGGADKAAGPLQM